MGDVFLGLRTRVWKERQWHPMLGDHSNIAG
jgi:hypothetical protein